MATRVGLKPYRRGVRKTRQFGKQIADLLFELESSAEQPTLRYT
jgi:hypothetical protein